MTVNVVSLGQLKGSPGIKANKRTRAFTLNAPLRCRNNQLAQAVAIAKKKLSITVAAKAIKELK